MLSHTPWVAPRQADLHSERLSLPGQISSELGKVAACGLLQSDQADCDRSSDEAGAESEQPGKNLGELQQVCAYEPLVGIEDGIPTGMIQRKDECEEHSASQNKHCQEHQKESTHRASIARRRAIRPPSRPGTASRR